MTYKEYVDGEITYEEYEAERTIDLMEHDTNARWVSILPLSAWQGLVLRGYGDPVNGSPIPVGSVVELPLEPDVTWQEASGVIRPSDLRLLIDHHDSE